MSRVGGLMKARPRLMIAIALGVLFYLLWPGAVTGLTRALAAWNVTVWVYLATVWAMMIRAEPARIRQIAQAQDENAEIVLAAVALACVVSLVTILIELASVKSASGIHQFTRIGFTAITLVGAWLMLPTSFAIHYAHQFYICATHDKKPVLFPDNPAEPAYWDFLYFSFTIAVACQTADVAVGDSATRRVVLAQSVLAFVFNLSVLGLSINVAAGLLN
ncbi:MULTISPECIES: DUF1345 domain-containing protein [Silvimonas]|uniref:DUF1345 domain-containing protein n=1 Tax=Silvimonas TaxID=300264 RepID=UPI0024B380FD|nr:MULTISPECIES: DUF1345 domain-containing protein [Silvimonas]MDR3428394.1 DUF1345 domain-containing protein [Silvimonas sp.]